MKIEERKFPRNWKYESESHKVTGVCQPYITGMYVAITDSEIPELIQLNIEHKKLKKWYAGLEKAMIEKGMSGETNWANYTDYLALEEMKKYQIFK